MKNYIIVDGDAIQRRIDELKDGLKIQQNKNIKNKIVEDEYHYRIAELEQILSQSTPLIPEIEKAFDAGSSFGEDCANSSLGVGNDYSNKQDYISNLKLDI